MMKKFYVTLLILFLIVIGSFSFYIYHGVSSKFPSEVIAHDEPPIEAVKRFMDMRYETLEEIARGYVLYTEQLSIVKMRHVDHTQNFKWGEYYRSEKIRSTKEIIDGFIKSPQGAFIYKKSKESIKKRISDKEESIRAIYKSADSYETKIEKDLGLDSHWLRYAYHGSYGAKQTILNYDDESLYELLRSLKTVMNGDNKQALWQAFSTQNENAIEKLRKEFNSAVFEEPIRFFHGNNAKFKTLSEDEIEILTLLIRQALLYYPYGRRLTVLEDTGVNLYLGEEILRNLNNRVRSALQEVRKGSLATNDLNIVYSTEMV